MPTGTIARLLIDKGFGFIRDEGGIEHFFHRSSVRGAVFELLREGQRVEFTPEDSQKGPRAGDVRLIEGLTGRLTSSTTGHAALGLAQERPACHRSPLRSRRAKVGGSAWESNPASPRERGATDFEDREGHRAPFTSVGSQCTPVRYFRKSTARPPRYRSNPRTRRPLRPRAAARRCE